MLYVRSVGNCVIEGKVRFWPDAADSLDTPDKIATLTLQFLSPYFACRGRPSARQQKLQIA